MKNGVYNEFDFESMLCDKYRIEVPVDFEHMRNKKIKVYDYFYDRNYIFSCSKKHTGKISLEQFVKIIKSKY